MKPNYRLALEMIVTDLASVIPNTANDGASPLLANYQAYGLKWKGRGRETEGNEVPAGVRPTLAAVPDHRDHGLPQGAAAGRPSTDSFS